MSRRTSRRRVIDDDDDDDNEEERPEVKVAIQREDQKENIIHRASRSSLSSTTINIGGESEDDTDGEVQVVGMAFSSQAPDPTQEAPPVRESERTNLLRMDNDKRQQAVAALSNVILRKAFNHETIDRAKCAKEANISEDRVTSAIFEEVEQRLFLLFGFKLRPIPKWMVKIKGLPARYKKEYYVTNEVQDTAGGTHSKKLHSADESGSIEKGLLMITLAFAYCKGQPRNDGSRWILDKDLYARLHDLDDNIPPEPPTPGSKKKRTAAAAFSPSNEITTPDVDALLEKFVKKDYLMRAKATEDQIRDDTRVEDSSFFYSMGPRSALEVGRRQVIYICAEVCVIMLV